MSIEALSKFIFQSRYSQYNHEKQRKETWEEAVERIMQMHRRKYSEQIAASQELADLIDFAEKLYKKKRVIGSQRNLQYGGESVIKHNMKSFNCTYTVIDRPRVFQEILYTLLCGSGVGNSVRKIHVDQIPALVTRSDETLTYVVPDSIEGWSDSVGVLISSYMPVEDAPFPEFSGRKVEFDFSEIRPKGSLIANKFKAPGPAGLRQSLEKIEAILDDAQGSKLRPIQCYDIIAHTSDAVLSGGIRRSALIVLFDHDDDEMMNAKVGDWFQHNPQRARSNNSACIIRQKCTREEFAKLIECAKSAGEPGFFFCDENDLHSGANPCLEISLYPKTEEGESGFAACVTADTKLITREGITKIGDAVGQEIEIWNGDEWSKVTPTKTGENKEIYRVSFNDGSYLDCTSNHRFLVKNKLQKDYREATCEDLFNNLENEKYVLSVPRTTISYEGGISEPRAYEYGLFMGDGSLNGERSMIRLYKDKKQLPIQYGELKGTGILPDVEFAEETYDHWCLDLDYRLSMQMRGKTDSIPEEIFSWDRESILKFAAGWADTAGSDTPQGMRIYGSEGRIKDLHLLLTKAGIASSLNLCREPLYVQITKTIDIPCHRLTCNNPNILKFQGEYQCITDIKKLPDRQDSFCVEEPNKHTCLFNNVLTLNCNLSELNGKYSKTKEEFLDQCRAASILGTLQAGYTKFEYLGEATEKIIEREALLGVSITGLMDNPDILFDPKIQEEGAEVVNSTNELVAGLLGINPAARTTCVKPSGSASIILESASGIHPHHARRYVRRVQSNEEEDALKLYQSINPLAVEKSVWSATGTDYSVMFPCEVERGAIVNNQLSAIEFLEKIKSTQQHWVKKGTNKDRCVIPYLEHNVSSTVNVTSDEEWAAVEEYLYDNRDYFTGVSLLSATGDLDYNQAPRVTVLTPRELVKEYGDASVFASGLVVDGLAAFGDLWDGCNCVLGIGEVLADDWEEPQYPKTRNFKDLAAYFVDREEYEKWALKKDWVRRVKQFADRYFEGDIKQATYCCKHVSLWKTWCDLNREFEDVDYSQMQTEATYQEADEQAAAACSGGACEIV